MSTPFRLAILISGNGSNLQAIIDAVQTGRLSAQIEVVVSNHRNAYGLVRAERAGIPTLCVPRGSHGEAGRTRGEYDRDLTRQVAGFRPDLIVLAGWMHVLSPAFLTEFPGKVINLHPALPGQFAGIQAIEKAYAAFQKGEIYQTGIMVHWVVPEVDAGPVIVSEIVPICPEDSPDDLEARVHAAEHRLLVEAIRRVITDKGVKNE